MTHRIFLAMTFALLLASCSKATDNAALAFKSTDISGADWGRDFSLVDHHQQVRTLADFRGKAVLLFFGYTHCPDACPIAMANMARVLDKLGPDSQRVQGLFVTVDPKRDTAQVLEKYLSAFHPSFLGLYADQATTSALAKEFKTFYAAEPAVKDGHDHVHDDYIVDHSSGIYAFDTRGRLRLYISNDKSVEDITHDVAVLLRE
ncbi:MAG: SCO family protein [Gammaproteobacteria bacterium]|nr:SCO family protein [Gammaproteobacteria bacterium]MBU0786608.1 SCO family protein [Gammaproteobacteria bacterium]MBU0814321.1 SCO family protein [Gammaproteobacteria bacterium]MBU1786159.1 SCO family protein [Gammaproteobacteria bacterium]